MVGARRQFSLPTRHRFRRRAGDRVAGLRPAAAIRGSLGRGLEVDDETRAVAGAFAKGANRAVMHFDDGFANRETETETFAAGAALLEGFEDFFQVLGLDPDAGVDDLDLKRAGLGIGSADGHGALPRSKFGGV